MFNYNLPQYKGKNLAVKLRDKAEKLLLKTAHPWIYEDSIKSINHPGKAGDVAVLFRNRTNKILGIGLYDPDSLIRIKVLHYYEPTTINHDFFKTKIIAALEVRKPFEISGTSGYRVIYGENDGFPGLIVDRYHDVLVVKVYSAIWYPYLEDILSILVERTHCKSIVYRKSRNLKDEHLEIPDGGIIYGKLEGEEVVFKEGKVSFIANVVRGHKTGFFLDQRKNREIVEAMAKGKRVLDVFSFNGGFAVHALAGGATEVTSVDISRQALESAKANVELNHLKGKFETIEGDAFEIMQQLKEENRVFDIVIIDPPSFANSKNQVDIALRKYQQLAALGAEITAIGGTLVLASCSSKVTPDVYFNTVETALKRQSHHFRLIRKTGHDIDHPVTFPEGEYLKCGYYKKER